MSTTGIPICPYGQIYNPITLRCVRIDKYPGTLIDAVRCTTYNLDEICKDPDLIYNPQLGQCISRNSKDGKLIEAVYNNIGCPYTHILNPETNRYVKITGKIGTEIAGKWNCRRYPQRDINYKFNPTNAQKEISNYFRNKHPYRGICLYWSLGSGKTCGSILMLDKYLTLNNVEKVYVFTSGSLRDNFIDQYCTICGKNPDIIKDKFEFVTYNYSLLKDTLPSKYDLDNTIIIIDEIHNIIRGYINKSENFVLIFNLLNSLKKSKFIFLSGTPITRYRSELYNLIKLLNPDAFKNITLSNFENLFDSKGVPNDNLKKIISSVFSRITINNSLSYYPTTMSQYIVIPMSKLQYNEYLRVRDSEFPFWPADERIKHIDPLKYKLTKLRYFLCITMLKSRQRCNMIYPRYMKNKEGNVKKNGFVDKLETDG